MEAGLGGSELVGERARWSFWSAAADPGSFESGWAVSLVAADDRAADAVPGRAGRAGMCAGGVLGAGVSLQWFAAFTLAWGLSPGDQFVGPHGLGPRHEKSDGRCQRLRSAMHPLLYVLAIGTAGCNFA